MTWKNLPNIQFESFYVSKEESNCPLISDAIRVDKKIKNMDFKDTIFSLRYGKRILINAQKDESDELKQNDFLEIVDYDPIKRVMLLMGPKKPGVETPLHWLIHHARNEVNAVVQIKNKDIIEKLKGTIMTTDKEYPPGTIEQAKEVLKCLRDSKEVIIKNQSIIFVGTNIKEAEDLILKFCEGVK